MLENILKVESVELFVVAWKQLIQIGPLLRAQSNQKCCVYLYCFYLHSKHPWNIAFVLIENSLI